MKISVQTQHFGAMSGIFHMRFLIQLLFIFGSLTLKKNLVTSGCGTLFWMIFLDYSVTILIPVG